MIIEIWQHHLDLSNWDSGPELINSEEESRAFLTVTLLNRNNFLESEYHIPHYILTTFGTEVISYLFVSREVQA